MVNLYLEHAPDAARASGYVGRADTVKGGVRNALYGFRP